MSTKKNIKYYLSLKWTYLIEQESDNGKAYYIISVNELPGVCTDATSIEKGMKDIKKVIKAAIELYLEQGETVPEPIDKKKFKGNIAYRTSSEKHYHLAKLAKTKHQSLSKTLDVLVDIGLEHLRERVI